MTDLSFFQIALNTVDLAATLRFYSEVFGFANAGGQAGWGDSMKIQGLEPTTQALCWWMIGRHPRIQLEIFHHTGPSLRSLPPDWSPADHGWVRFGIAVSDFDGVTDRLSKRNITAIGGTGTTNGLRHLAIRDPYCGIVIEVWEDGNGIPGGVQPRGNAFDPVILYATSSVPDLAAARHFYSNVVGLPIAPIESLHSDADEALWGLPNAKRDGFVVEAGAGFVEVVQYSLPQGHPRTNDYRLSDQGIMNVGFFGRNNEAVKQVIKRLDAEGKPPLWLTTGEGVLGIYLNQPAREIELLSCPEAIEPFIGFMPQGPFNASEHIKMVPYSRKMLDD